MFKKIFTLVIAGTLLFISCAPAPLSEENEPPITEPPITEAPITQAPFIEKDYFDGFPNEYRDMRLPQEIIEILDAGGRVVPLPPDPFSLQVELESAAQSFGYDLTRYDLNRVVTFTSDDGYDYISVPSNSGFAKDGCAGLILDRNGAYRGEYDMYEVWFYEDRAVLRNPNGNEVILYREEGMFFPTQEGAPGEIPLVVFVHNGCWLCGCLLGRCGCVFCK